jgi:hypothetical protein
MYQQHASCLITSSMRQVAIADDHVGFRMQFSQLHQSRRWYLTCQLAASHVDAALMPFVLIGRAPLAA